MNECLCNDSQWSRAMNSGCITSWVFHLPLFTLRYFVIFEVESMCNIYRAQYIVFSHSISYILPGLVKSPILVCTCVLDAANKADPDTQWS